MKNKSLVLVTGGAGFIGSHLVDALLAEGYRVRVLDNLANGSFENLENALACEHFEFVKGDILDLLACETAMQGVDFVFHLACLGVRHSIHSPFENHRVNAEGTLRILESARQHQIKHFFYISTSEVYGRTNIFPIQEGAPTFPLTVYGASKLAGEHYTQSYYECYGLPITIFRIFNNYGARAHFKGDAGEIIPRSIVQILQGKSPVIFGDGSVTRDFFYVKDTAKVLCHFLEIAQNSPSKINAQLFNIGAGKELSMKTLLEHLLAAMGRQDLPIKFLPARPADVPRLWVDAQKFYNFTGFHASPFEESLLETIDFYRARAGEFCHEWNFKIQNWEK